MDNRDEVLEAYIAQYGPQPIGSVPALEHWQTGLIFWRRCWPIAQAAAKNNPTAAPQLLNHQEISRPVVDGPPAAPNEADKELRRVSGLLGAIYLSFNDDELRGSIKDVMTGIDDWLAKRAAQSNSEGEGK